MDAKNKYVSKNKTFSFWEGLVFESNAESNTANAKLQPEKQMQHLAEIHAETPFALRLFRRFAHEIGGYLRCLHNAVAFEHCSQQNGAKDVPRAGIVDVYPVVGDKRRRLVTLQHHVAYKLAAGNAGDNGATAPRLSGEIGKDFAAQPQKPGALKCFCSSL